MALVCCLRLHSAMAPDTPVAVVLQIGEYIHQTFAWLNGERRDGYGLFCVRWLASCVAVLSYPLSLLLGVSLIVCYALSICVPLTTAPVVDQTTPSTIPARCTFRPTS